MTGALKRNRLAWLAIGLWLGLLAALAVSRRAANQPVDIAGFLPEKAIHAVATDRSETFAMATGPVDEEVEAVYFLDFLTGDLRAVILGKQGNGFQAFYNYNVLADFKVDPSKNPRFLMVTGMVNIRRGAARVQPSLAAVYVAEVTTGQVAAYAIPWQQGLRAGVQVARDTLIPLGKTSFRAAQAGAAAPPAKPQ